jgi:hypothetical protein
VKSLLPVVIAAFVVAGCVDQKAWIRKFAPKDDDQFARQFLDLVRHAQYVEATKMVDAAVARQAGANGLNQLHQVLDHGDPVAVELIGANTGFFKPWSGAASKRQSSLTYQLQFRDSWVVAAFVIESSGSDRHISGVNLQPLPTSLEFLNRFTVEDKTPIHLLFLVACIGVPLLIVVTLMICLFSRVRRRWLWVIFILFGFTQFQLNWTTGQTGFQPISFLILGASFFRAGLYAPIVFSFGIPVGAILFLLLRGWLLIKDEPPDLPSDTIAPSSI